MHDDRGRAQRPGRFWAAARAHALAAARHGLSVFPLTRSKFPAIASPHPDDDTCTGQCGTIGHGVYDATTDPVKVAELFAAGPWAAGYGIACGRAPHHLFGLDLDRKNGVDGVANIRALADRHGFTLPRTALVISQSGGLHAWLSAPADAVVPNTAGYLAPGVDTRGSGGYLVGPGSVGRTGRYAFAAGSGPQLIAPVPARLLELLTAPQKAPQADREAFPARPLGSPRRRLDGLVRTVRQDDAQGRPDAAEGGRNSRLYWAARKAYGSPDIDPDTATAELLDAARAVGLLEAEALHTLSNARKGAARDRKEARP